MSIASKSELSVLSHEEQEMVRVTHHPAIYELDGEALKSLQRRLRDQRGKMRTFVRRKRREARTEHVEAARQALALARAEKFAQTRRRATRREQDRACVGPFADAATCPAGTIGSIVKANKVAQAARTARILWAMLTHNQPYRAPAIG